MCILPQFIRKKYLISGEVVVGEELVVQKGHFFTEMQNTPSKAISFLLLRAYLYFIILFETNTFYIKMGPVQ